MAGVSRGASLLSIGGAAFGIALWSCAVPWLGILRFALLLVALYFAGRFLSPRGLEGTQAVATGIALGMAAAVVLWASALLVGLPPQLSFVGLAALAAAQVVGRNRTAIALLPVPVVLAVLGCAASVAWTQFGSGRASTSGADVTFTHTYAREALFHCAIAQEMRHGLVVHFPAGSALPYHVGYHLLAALTAEATGTSMVDVNNRLLPALLVPGTALAAAAFAEAWGAGVVAAAGGAVALFFADDLSWIFGAAGMRNESALGSPAWNLLLGTPLLYGLHHNRGFLTGALVFFVTLALLGRFLRAGGRHELVAGSALAAALVHCKVSYFLVTAGALGITAALAVLSKRRAPELPARAITATLLVAAIALPLLLAFALARPGDDVARFAPFPTYIGVSSLVRIGIFPNWDALRSTAETDPVRFSLVWFPAGVALLTLGTTGVRALGLRELVVRTRELDPLAWVATGVLAIGFVLGLAFYTPPDRFNIAYFWALALLVLAVLAGITLASPSNVRRRALVVGAVILGLPGTLQFLWVERSIAIEPALRVPAGVVEAADYLSVHAQAGDVVLEPDPSSSVLAALAPVRPVMAWADWLRYSLGKPMVQERVRDVRTFFTATDSDARRQILERYRVRWVWSPHGGAIASLPDARRVLTNRDGELWQLELKSAAAPRHPVPKS